MKRFRLERRSHLENELRKAHESLSAFSEGRAFVGRTRIIDTDDSMLQQDCIVTIWPREKTVEPTILHDDADWVAVDKPAGIPTIADHAGIAHSLIESTRRVLNAREPLHPTSRLDRDVSGIVVFAKNARGRRLFEKLREDGRYHRRYLGIGVGLPPEPPIGTFRDAIGRAPNPRLRAIGGKGATSAMTHYALVGSVGLATPRDAAERACMYAFTPITGRTHQIRLHASHHGTPLLGDHVYGGRRALTDENGSVRSVDRIALHATRILLGAPGRQLQLDSGIPLSLAELWMQLRGDPNDFEAGRALPLPPK